MGVYAPCNQYNFRNESSKSIFDRLKQNFNIPGTQKRKTQAGTSTYLSQHTFPIKTMASTMATTFTYPTAQPLGITSQQTTFCLAIKLPTFTAQYQPPYNNTSRKTWETMRARIKSSFSLAARKTIFFQTISLAQNREELRSSKTSRSPSASIAENPLFFLLPTGRNAAPSDGLEQA